MRCRSRRAASTNSRKTLEHDGWYEEEPPEQARDRRAARAARASIISRNKSPDIRFQQSINPYRDASMACHVVSATPAPATPTSASPPASIFETQTLLTRADAADAYSRTRTRRRTEATRCAPIMTRRQHRSYQPLEEEHTKSRASHSRGAARATTHPVHHHHQGRAGRARRRPAARARARRTRASHVQHPDAQQRDEARARAARRFGRARN